MIQFKSIYDLTKLPPDDPAYSIIEDLAKKLLVTTESMIRPYDPEADGWLVLVEEADADPKNQKNKDLLADVYEQLGYQQETPGLRNSFLAAAFELRSGFPEGAPPKASGPDVIRAMSTELFLEFIGIRMDSKKAENFAFKINLITPDNGEKFVAELSNATFTVIEGQQVNDADLTITINRTDLEMVMMGVKTLQAQIDDGTAKLSGNPKVLKQLAGTLSEFSVAFEIIPGTVNKRVAKEELNDFEVGPIVTAHE